MVQRVLSEKNLINKKNQDVCRPLLKWAGGKTQLLREISSKIPIKFERYIEPFFGGGAVFFSIMPEQGIIADSNPELINLYRCIADDVDAVLAHLRIYENTEDVFYLTRALNFTDLTSSAAAARTIFLNKTCFNGLYRVNKKGNFNVPFGRYKNPKIVDEPALRAASTLLSRTTIICDDYKNVLKNNAKKGDLVFLDPPYLPVSIYSDFKRYTKEQFSEADHHDLAIEIARLHDLGCHVILTNSNHPLVHKQYRKFEIEVIPTKRYISCKSANRTGEDIIVNIPCKSHFENALISNLLKNNGTSKSKISKNDPGLKLMYAEYS